MRVSMKPLLSVVIVALFVVFGVVLFKGSVVSMSSLDQQDVLLAAQVPPDETATATPVPTNTPMVFAECGWGPEASAFIDANGNGRRDRGEEGLAGVTFHVEEAYSHTQDIQEATSDDQGMAQLGFLYGCGGPPVEFEVYAVPPTGYVLTTPAQVHEGEPVVFGFRPANALPGMPGAGHP